MWQQCHYSLQSWSCTAVDANSAKCFEKIMSTQHYNDNVSDFILTLTFKIIMSRLCKDTETKGLSVKVNRTSTFIYIVTLNNTPLICTLIAKW